MICDRLREQLSLRVIVWKSVVCIDHNCPNSKQSPAHRPIALHLRALCDPIQPCGPVHFSVAAAQMTFVVTYNTPVLLGIKD